MAERTTFNNDSEPDVIDEIVRDATSLHIEQMDKSCYWMRVGEQIFWIKAHKGGQCKITQGDD